MNNSSLHLLPFFILSLTLAGLPPLAAISPGFGLKTQVSSSILLHPPVIPVASSSGSLHWVHTKSHTHIRKTVRKTVWKNKTIRQAPYEPLHRSHSPKKLMDSKREKSWTLQFQEEMKLQEQQVTLDRAYKEMRQRAYEPWNYMNNIPRGRTAGLSQA